MTQAAAKLTKARRLLKQSHIPPIHRSDIPQLLAASYRASRKAMQAAGRSGSASDLHEWRKRVKTLWYHLRLFESIAPPLRGEIQRLEHLETWLGEHHNLAVLQATIAGDRTLSAQADAVKGATMLFRSAQRTLCRKALDEGRLLFGDSPRKFAGTAGRDAHGDRRKRAGGSVEVIVPTLDNFRVITGVRKLERATGIETD